MFNLVNGLILRKSSNNNKERRRSRSPSPSRFHHEEKKRSAHGKDTDETRDEVGPGRRTSPEQPPSTSTRDRWYRSVEKAEMEYEVANLCVSFKGILSGARRRKQALRNENEGEKACISKKDNK